jgi:hypothetical protein
MKIAHLMNACLLLAARCGCAARNRSQCSSTAPAYFDVARGAYPHDVAATPAAGGPVHYTAIDWQARHTRSEIGQVQEIVLGPRSRRTVIVGPDGAAWIMTAARTQSFVSIRSRVKSSGRCRACRLCQPQYSYVRQERPDMVSGKAESTAGRSRVRRHARAEGTARKRAYG